MGRQRRPCWLSLLTPPCRQGFCARPVHPSWAILAKSPYSVRAHCSALSTIESRVKATSPYYLAERPLLQRPSFILTFTDEEQYFDPSCCRNPKCTCFPIILCFYSQPSTQNDLDLAHLWSCRFQEPGYQAPVEVLILRLCQTQCWRFLRIGFLSSVEPLRAIVWLSHTNHRRQPATRCTCLTASIGLCQTRTGTQDPILITERQGFSILDEPQRHVCVIS